MSDPEGFVRVSELFGVEYRYYRFGHSVSLCYMLELNSRECVSHCLCVLSFGALGFCSVVLASRGESAQIAVLDVQ